MTNENQLKWILPPILAVTLDRFKILYDVLYRNESDLKKRPLIIMGQPGIGKTLFTNVFIELYKNTHGTGCKDVHVNIAAIPEKLIESQLFGYEKGAFTDARQSFEGFLKAASGGILVLEEIGELPKSVQAKLLTYVEDGIFYKIGSTKPVPSENVQIVATTNKSVDDDVFRQDFFDRFFPLYVPPLHRRRRDILYYWASMFPDIMQKLNSWEVLTLLTYNWPGNVREIERVGNRIRWENGLGKKNKRRYFEDRQLLSLSSGYTALRPHAGYKIYEELKDFGVEVELLEAAFRKYGIGLTEKGKMKKAFQNFDANEPRQKIASGGDDSGNKNLQIVSYEDYEPIEQAYKGLELFCQLFQKDIQADTNLLNMDNDDFTDIMGEPFFGYEKEYTPAHDVLIKRIYDFVKLKKSSVASPNDLPNLLNSTEDQYLSHYQKKYLEELLKKHRGNQTAAAKNAGLPGSTFRDHCKKCGIPLVTR